VYLLDYCCFWFSGCRVAPPDAQFRQSNVPRDGVTIMLHGKYQLFRRDDNRSRRRIDSPAIAVAKDFTRLKYIWNTSKLSNASLINHVAPAILIFVEWNYLCVLYSIFKIPDINRIAIWSRGANANLGS
jgi:hypothetical protein